MGLDMFAYITKALLPQFDFDQPDDAEQIAYWRKHPDLHGWMEDCYRAKGGNAEFNCMPVRLDAQDIDALERAVTAEALPTTAGFFFGKSRPEDKPLDIAFIKAAREAIEDGFRVYYTSWW